MRRDEFTHVGRLSDLAANGCLAVQVEGRTLALFYHRQQVFAVDNRCPHMGFPLQRGTVQDGILTCHWHHARFDLASGGTFDPWADDVPVYPVEIRQGEIWVALGARRDPGDHYQARLRDGLEQDLPLVIAKAVISLLDLGHSPSEPFRSGLQFGVSYREAGWGQGLTILTCMFNLLPHLHPDQRSPALYHGLCAVARDSAGAPPRFQQRPLPVPSSDPVTLTRWFRQFIEVRDAEGAERCLLSAIQVGAAPGHLAEMLFSAATDHRYLDNGHALDFTNKALEALDAVGWSQADQVLPSLVRGYARADRMEEANAWRHPIDLVKMLELAFDDLPAAARPAKQTRYSEAAARRLVPVLLGEDPQAIVNALLDTLRDGCPPADLGAIVAYSAALRLARFHTSNEFGDWDTALHTFTFANAVHQGLRRLAGRSGAVAGYPPLLRGVFDAAMSVYLDRFLNIPAARIPDGDHFTGDPAALLDELLKTLDRQQQVTAAAELAATYLTSGGQPERLTAALGKALLREDRDFHTIQAIEAIFRLHAQATDPEIRRHLMIAAVRYLAAHTPTPRAQNQTFQIAHRLSKGENIFEAEP